MRPRQLGLRTLCSRSICERHQLCSHQIFSSRCKYTIARLVSHMSGARLFAIQRALSRLVTTPRPLLWLVCDRRLLRCRLACMLPPSSLDPRIAARAFALAEDSLETNAHWIAVKSIGHSHLPYLPWVFRMILGRTETVEITSQTTNDRFHLHEIPPSRVAKQLIGLPVTPELARSLER